MEESSSVDLLQTQLKFTLWFIGVLMSVLSVFIVRAFNGQAKKDDLQDKHIEKLSDTMDSIKEVAMSMREMIARHDTDIKWLMNSIDKATKR